MNNEGEHVMLVSCFNAVCNYLIIKVVHMIIEYDEFDLTVASIPDSVLEGSTSIVSTSF